MRPKAHQTRRHRFGARLALGLVLIIVFGGCSFVVQPIEEFTSADGFLSFTFPANWDLVKEESGAGSVAAMISTRGDLVDLEVIPPGVAGVAVLLMPDFLPGPDGETIPVTAQELAGVMRNSAMTEQPGVGDLETITLKNGTEVYAFNAPSPEADMKMHILSPAQGAIVVVALISAPGETDGGILSVAESILESVRFSGDPVEFTERAHAVVDSGQ